MISIVVGSWGSYTECNERALGSKWLDLSAYDDWEEIEEELANQGFIFNGIDEELFIQDIEGIPSNCANWDYMHPQRLFETLYNSGILYDTYKYAVFEAYLDVRSFADWEDLVNNYGEHWDDDIILHPKMDFEDLAYHMIHEACCYEIPSYKTLNISMIMDSYGRFTELWEFSACLVAKGFNILEVHKADKFTDGNFPKAEQDNEHVILSFAQCGKPDVETNENKKITVANRYYYA